MLERIPAPVQGATNTADSNVGKSVQIIRKNASDENWFPDMCRELLAKPGLELHLLADIDERSCHRYASGDVKPPGGLVRTLLRGPRGEAFMAFLMHDSAENWWRDLQRDANAARAFMRSMASP